MEYIQSLLGGVLIGVAVVGYLFTHGRVAGVSGMISQQFNLKGIFQRSSFWFLVGLMAVTFIYQQIKPLNIQFEASAIWLVVSGLLVGFGTRLGSGCTSGHGVCGISRLSLRSIIATLVFMCMGFLTVFIFKHYLA
ncbi:YeeE/YedE family protein [Acinetobacter boissieri]|uniref:Uncharacterized protein n=1 Tax=Acinetobacter boissieri TaxID=1219383 RepID=A0A1G6HKP3_9GAMM|nr:YeeE/YedE thiosulfate transporter family protein [Acinetobacter boissieri]SDB94743.1 hypothetical protein SAMN05421733_106107 [Acinetobacter boissieri]